MKLIGKHWECTRLIDKYLSEKATDQINDEVDSQFTKIIIKYIPTEELQFCIEESLWKLKEGLDENNQGS